MERSWCSHDKAFKILPLRFASVRMTNLLLGGALIFTRSKIERLKIGLKGKLQERNL